MLAVIDLSKSSEKLLCETFDHIICMGQEYFVSGRYSLKCTSLIDKEMFRFNE